MKEYKINPIAEGFVLDGMENGEEDTEYYEKPGTLKQEDYPILKRDLDITWEYARDIPPKEIYEEFSIKTIFPSERRIDGFSIKGFEEALKDFWTDFHATANKRLGLKGLLNIFSCLSPNSPRTIADFLAERKFLKQLVNKHILNHNYIFK